MTTTPYTTRRDCACPRDGDASWVQLPSGVWITNLPLWDPDEGIFAELTYRDALTVAERHGARLPKPGEIVELNAHSLRLDPFFMPSAPMIDQEGERRGHALHEAEIDAWRNENMSGLEWAQIHTAEMLRRLEHSEWSGGAVSNIGKHWVAGAPAGRAYLAGWFYKGRFMQPLPALGSRGPHDDGHHDYGTTTILVADSDPRTA